MKKNIVFIVTLIFFLGTNLLAQDNSESKLKISFSERFRMVMWDNAIDLNDSGSSNQNFTRMRTTLGLNYKPVRNLEFNVKLTNEFRYYFTPSTPEFHLNEVIVDQLYFKLKSEQVLPGVLTIGRQNIMLGEGFVILDGHPGDGSRSAYFNAIRYDWNISPNHILTGFFAYQPEEDFLPVINGKDIDAAFQGDDSYQLIEQTEKTAALYYNGSFSDINLQSYGIWKQIVDDGWQLTPKSDIYTFGARVKVPATEKLNVTAEAAYQAGTIGDEDRAAYGGYVYATYLPKVDEAYCPVSINVGSFILSGDDPSTTKYEGWEPQFSRWPKWSESYIYTSLKENQGRVAYWSNMLAAYIQTKFDLGQGFGLDLNYYQLYAVEETNATSFLSGSGKNRGGLVIGKLSYKISENVTGHILWEHFAPGNFYFDGADSYHWARMEFLYQI